MPPAADIQTRRQEIRRKSIADREALTPADHAARSRKLHSHLHARLMALAPAKLAFCWPYRAEFDARPLVLELLARNWRACLPVVGEKAAPMRFRAWTPQTEMAPDRHGIQTPQDGEWMTPEIILLPFNALDRRGYRLGYGAGYFDRTLAILAPGPQVVGVGFALGLVDSIHPQPHDVPVDWAVTEEGVLHPL